MEYIRPPRRRRPRPARRTLRVAPLSYGGLLGPAGLPEDVKRQLSDACIAILKGEAAQKIAKNTFQPADFLVDSAGFKRNLDNDLAEKTRLLPLLHAK
jgi:hypothetical protein